MRLIDVHTRLLHEFYDANVPPYAILSHTWGDDEVTYEELSSNLGRDKHAYRKIRFLCNQAIADDLQWAWLDTCCINKASSAELSEAINSMFRWYRRARCCYAFLSDITGDVYWSKEPGFSFETISSALASSRWFQRGWCLQELIAPPQEKFYGHSWNYLGDRDVLAPAISRITGIREKVLLDPQKEVSRCSVAEKMSWAASRQTSREEDTAYCLLGIFEVNMPMLYGEAKRAFLRLQEEIIKATDDHSIFIWQPHDADERHLLLAPEPSRFAEGALVVTIPALHHVDGHTLGNTGLRISLPLSPVSDRPGCYHAILGCRYRDDYQNVIALCLQSRLDIGLADRAGTAHLVAPNSAIDPTSQRRKSRADVASADLPSALFIAPTIAREQRYVLERAPRRLEDFPESPSFMISRTLPIAEQDVLFAGAKYWFDTKDSTSFNIVAAYPPECFNSQTFVMDLTNHLPQYGAVLVSLSEDVAKAAGFEESTWRSRSLAVVFGSWTVPGRQASTDSNSIGIFGVVQTDLKNLSNACRLAVSKSIYRSPDASQQHVAWVRSTYTVPWDQDHHLHVSFKGDRRIGILSEVVNIISMKLQASRGLPDARPMQTPLLMQTEERVGNSLSVQHLQDVVRSYDESELDGRRNSLDAPRAEMIYELEDDSWRASAQLQEADESGDSDDYEAFVLASSQPNMFNTLKPSDAAFIAMQVDDDHGAGPSRRQRR